MRNFLLLITIFISLLLHNNSHAQDTIVQNKPVQDTVPQEMLPKWWTLFEIGIQSGLGEVEVDGVIYPNSHVLPSFQIINSYLIHPQIIAGLGIGVQPYDQGGMMPIFLDLRAFTGKKNFLPMFVFDVGYSFGWQTAEGEREWVGLMINPAVGFIIKRVNNGVFFFNAGYRLQKTGYAAGFFDLVMVPTTHLSIRLGLKF